MRCISRLLAAGALLAVPAFSPALAADPPRDTAPPVAGAPAEQAKRGFDLLMKALEGWLHQFPFYAVPEVTPEGDIIIRRLDRARPPVSSRPDTPGGATDL